MFTDLSPKKLHAELLVLELLLKKFNKLKSKKNKLKRPEEIL